jgi:hypothetical protein
LVSVVSGGKGYVLFFQAKDASVHSLGIDGSGSIDSDFIFIPAK